MAHASGLSDREHDRDPVEGAGMGQRPEEARLPFLVRPHCTPIPWVLTPRTGG